MKAFAALLLIAAAPQAAPVLHPGTWFVLASDDVSATIKQDAGMRLDYDFGRVSGFAGAKAALPIEWPGNFVLRLRIRGQGGANDLQLKFVDASGDNVWWVRKEGFRPSADWQVIDVPVRDVEWAWGPDKDRTLRRTASVELVVARGAEGGKGWIELGDLSLRPLPGAPAPKPPAERGINDTLASIAKAAPRGAYPRGFTEQSYWTLVGADGASDSGLIGEDGAVELGKGGPSIEPFVLSAGRRYSWADVAETQSLEDGYLPIPHVTWNGPGWTLDTSAFADVSDPQGRLFLRYRLTNKSAERQDLRLALALRPFQVNPPAQFLSQRGGHSPVDAVERTSAGLTYRVPAGERGVASVEAPSSFAAWTGAALMLPRSPSTAIQSVRGAEALASGAMLYAMRLAPGETREVRLVAPLHGAAQAVDAAVFERAYQAARASWHAKLDAVGITLPASKRHIADSVRSGLAHMLMSRAGPALKPGTRSYDRSWIRDGAMISDGLLRLGQVAPVVDYARWYSAYQFSNGKVPCCVDFRGADPVPENDSQGEYIHLVTQLYRYTGDKAVLERYWPQLTAAWRYMDAQRLSERTATNRTPERQMLYGLLPPSISHEGYSAKPQYSLWDDFWGLRGYKDAVIAAEALGKPEAASMAAARDQFAGDIHAAIAAAAAFWKIDHIPGATSNGDFDATSTTIALGVADESARLDPALTRNTFERMWRKVMARRGATDWQDYTPYELRNVSAFVRLGWRERANALLDFYFADQRPRAWNGWAEVVGRDPREIRFIGDMPHAWISSDYIRAALDLFAYERAEDESVVLGAGLTADYLAGEGVAIRGLRTSHGAVDFSFRRAGGDAVAMLGGTARVPGGYVLTWPLASAPGRTTVDGRSARWAADGLHVPADGREHKVVVRIGR
ncbi:hypothetical protein [Sphingomonas aracearum]|uniref:Uncharacterized protein n=1 Tax=Sphingomonas aracearum TaxID=2283317 RepID=A0A369VVT1_9SPHN|nr:hypothetical protein [Sphingomonas aracearum]RDE06203.1 hypothetical protein DVW87_00205 [Sphingomonas aracearum]